MSTIGQTGSAGNPARIELEEISRSGSEAAAEAPPPPAEAPPPTDSLAAALAGNALSAGLIEGRVADAVKGAANKGDDIYELGPLPGEPPMPLPLNLQNEDGTPTDVARKAIDLRQQAYKEGQEIRAGFPPEYKHRSVEELKRDRERLGDDEMRRRGINPDDIDRLAKAETAVEYWDNMIRDGAVGALKEYTDGKPIHERPPIKEGDPYSREKDPDGR